MTRVQRAFDEAREWTNQVATRSHTIEARAIRVVSTRPRHDSTVHLVLPQDGVYFRSPEAGVMPGPGLSTPCIAEQYATADLGLAEAIPKRASV